MNNIPKPLLYVLILLFFIFISKVIILINNNLKVILKEKRYNWEKTEAIIKSIDLELTPNLEHGELSELFPNKKCKIKYSYEFNQIKYTSEKLGISHKNASNSNGTSFFDNNEFHNSLFEKLKNKKRIFIYVNPEKPMNTSLIKYDLNYKKIGSLIVSLIFSISIGLGIYDSFKHPANSISKKIKLVK